MKKLNRLFKIFSFTVFLLPIISCSDLTSPIGETQVFEKTDSNELYTISGKVELNGAVPQEVADNFWGTSASAAGGTGDSDANGARTAFPVVNGDVSCKIICNRKNGDGEWEYQSDISVADHMFEIQLSEGTYKLQAEYKVDANVVLKSDPYELSVGPGLPRPKPVLKLYPFTDSNCKGYIKLGISIDNAVFDNVTFEMMELGSTDTSYSCDKDLSLSNGKYYIGTNDVYADENWQDDENLVYAGQYIMNLYFYKDNKIVYYCSEVINVFNRLTTNVWFGNESYKYNQGQSTSYITITANDVKNFAMSNVYVDETSQVANAYGTFQEPFKNLNAAIDYINRSAAAFDAAGGTDPAPEYTIWLKSDVTKFPSTNNNVFIIGREKGAASSPKTFTIRSYGSNGIRRTVNASQKANEQFPVFSLIADYYIFVFKDLIFKNYRQAISSVSEVGDNFTTSITLDNCTFESLKTADCEGYAVNIVSGQLDMQVAANLTLKGQTSFAEDAVIVIDNIGNIKIDSSFTCQKTLCANIKVSQGNGTNKTWEYSNNGDKVSIGQSIITLSSDIDEANAKTLLSKFKVSNFWYDIKAVENVSAGCFEGKVIPHMYVSPAGGGNGTEKSPCTLEQAITNYNRFKAQNYVNLNTPITITLGAGEYNSWNVNMLGSLNNSSGGALDNKINLTLEGAGKWNNNTGTLIKVNEVASTSRVFSFCISSGYSGKCSVKNLTIDGNGQRFVNIPFYFVNADADFENVAIVNIKANSGSGSNHEPMILVSEGNLSIKNCDIKGCYIKKVNEGYSEGYDVRRLLLSYSGKADKTFKISGKNRIEDNYLVDDLDSLTNKIPLNNIYLSTFNSPSVQSVLTVTGSLAGSSIGVVTETDPIVTEPVVFTSGYSDRNIIANLREIFKGNGFVVCPTDDNKEGQLILDGGELSQKPTYEKVKIGVSRRTIDLSAANPVKTITVTATDDGNAISARTFNLINLYSDDELVSSSDATVNLENGTINLSKLSAGVYTLEVEMKYKNHNYTALIDITIIKQDDLSNMTSAPVSGTYKIGTSESIAKLREWVRSDVDLSKVTFEMTNDIELPSNFTSIGSEASPFKGTFDGKGYSLILTGVDSSCTSIFGSIQTMNMGTSQNPDYRYGIVKNLVVESKSTLSLNHEFYVIAKNIIRGKISNCINKCNIKTTTGGVTGFVEKLNSASIYNCKNEGTIISENDAAAGILIEMTDDCYAYNCFNTGNITGNGTASGNNYKECSAAGIAIYNFGYLINCLNYGNVTGKNITGGIAAKGFNPSNKNGIFNCCNVGIIKSIESSAGGIVGTDYNTSSTVQKLTIKNCVNYGNVSGKSSAFAIVGFRYEKLDTDFANLYYLKGTAEKGVYNLEDASCSCASFEKGSTEETAALDSLNDKTTAPSTIGADSLLIFKFGQDGYPVFDE